VRIGSIDLGFNRVTFSTPNGEQRRATVRNPEMRRFMRTLRVGDQVDVTFAKIAPSPCACRTEGASTHPGLRPHVRYRNRMLPEDTP